MENSIQTPWGGTHCGLELQPDILLCLSGGCRATFYVFGGLGLERAIVYYASTNVAHVLVGRAASPASSVKRQQDVDLIAGVLVCDAAAFCLLKAVERLAATDAVEVQARHAAPIVARTPAFAVERDPPVSPAEVLVAGPAVDERSHQDDE